MVLAPPFPSLRQQYRKGLAEYLERRKAGEEQQELETVPEQVEEERQVVPSTSVRRSKIFTTVLKRPTTEQPEDDSPTRPAK